jgi:hypothetical protein
MRANKLAHTSKKKKETGEHVGLFHAATTFKLQIKRTNASAKQHLLTQKKSLDSCSWRARNALLKTNRRESFVPKSEKRNAPKAIYRQHGVVSHQRQ